MFEELGRSLDNLLQRVTSGASASRIEMKTDPITVDYPELSPARLRVEIGVGDLVVAAGGEKLVDGTATYNVQEWAPVIAVEGDKVTVKQGSAFVLWPLMGDAKNDWHLRLGTARPYHLTVTKGVAAARLALGGLPLTGLLVEMGTGETRLNFDRANPQRAERVDLHCGTGELEATGLLNTGAASVMMSGGTGKVTLGFTGESLLQNMNADISLGVGEAIITLKAGIPARIKTSQGLGSVRVMGNFKSTGSHVYETPDYSTTTSPKLTLKVNSGIGSVIIETE
jgi:hypothetical protein